MSNIDRLNAAKKFHIKLRPSDHIVSHRGIGFVFKCKPVVTVSANPDGACGKEYVEKERMRNCFTWGTELEIVVLSQISGHDVFAYTQHKNWVRYSANMKCDDPRTPTAFYLNNSSGNHFDPVLTSRKW